MAVYAFTRAILDGTPIHVANSGRIWRDFTYIDDIIEGVFRVMEKPPGAQAASDVRIPSPADSSAPYRVYNIGNGKPEELNRLIRLIEIALGREARRIDAPMPPGDIVRSHADTTALSREIDYVPSTPLDVGVRRFVDWYLDYHAQSKQRDRKRMELVGHC